VSSVRIYVVSRYNNTTWKFDTMLYSPHCKNESFLKVRSKTTYIVCTWVGCLLPIVLNDKCSFNKKWDAHIYRKMWFITDVVSPFIGFDMIIYF